MSRRNRKLGETHVFGTDITVKMEATELGYIGDAQVTAATDAAGSQVIVRSKTIHLLSRPLKDHAAAVKLGQEIVAAGATEIYKEWFDLIKGDGVGLFAIFGGPFRDLNPDPEILDEVAKNFLKCADGVHEVRSGLLEE